MNYRQLSRIFARSTIGELATNYRSRVIRDIAITQNLQNSPQNLSYLFDHTYEEMGHNYRNEYYFKNELIAQYILPKYSRDRLGILTEFRAGKGKTDVVALNGTSWAYEIKTEFDNISRLQHQITSYKKIFEHVAVVTHEKLAKFLSAQLDKSIGIIVLNDDSVISVKRKSISNQEDFDITTAFRSLRKNEYLKVARQHFGTVPEVPATLLFDVILDRTKSEINTYQFHKYVVSQLKARSRKNLDWTFLDKLPRSLTLHGLTGNYSQKEINNIIKLLNIPIPDYIALCK